MPYQRVMIIPAEITPAVSVLRFWPETEVVPLAAYITIFLVAIAVPNVFHVRIYGHIEYYMSFVKCLAVIAMIFFMFVMTSKIFVVNSNLRAVLYVRYYGIGIRLQTSRRRHSIPPLLNLYRCYGCHVQDFLTRQQWSEII